MKIRKIESRYLRSDFLIELIVSILAGLSAIIWTAIFTSETTILDVRTTLRAKYLQAGIEESKKFAALDQQVTVVTIPENVMIRYERSGDNRTTPRDYMAKLIDAIAYYKPKVIALDYVFDHPTKAGEDSVLLASMRKAGNVVIGYEQLPTIHGYSTVMTDNLKAFMEAALGVGYLNMVRDKDGLIRSYEFARDGDSSFAHRIVAAYAGIEHPRYKPAEDNLEPVLNVPPAARKHFSQRGLSRIYAEKSYLNYRLPLKQTFVIYDNSDDLLKPFPNPVIADKIRDRIVIIGDGTYKSDLHKTPFSDTDRADSPADTPGVLIQALAVRNLLNADLMTQASALLQLLLVLLTGLVAFVVSLRLRFLAAVGVIFALISVYWLAVFVAYHVWSLWLPVVSPTIGMFSVGLLLLVFRIALSEKDNLDGADLLAGNLPAHTLERCEAEEQQSIFTSREGEALLLIATAHNLLSGVATLSAPQQSDFINYYYAQMQKVVFAAHGGINRLPDGGFLAFWNLPLRDDAALVKARQCAADLADQLTLVNRKLHHHSANAQTVTLSLFLETGKVLAGYIGQENAREYIIVGETVSRALHLAREAARRETGKLVATDDVVVSVPAEKLPVMKYTEISGKRCVILA